MDVRNTKAMDGGPYGLDTVVGWRVEGAGLIIAAVHEHAYLTT